MLYSLSYLYCIFNRLWAHYACSEVEFECNLWRGEVVEALQAHGGLICTSLKVLGALEVHLESLGGVCNHLESIGGDLEHLEANYAILRCEEML